MNASVSASRRTWGYPAALRVADRSLVPYALGALISSVLAAAVLVTAPHPTLVTAGMVALILGVGVIARFGYYGAATLLLLAAGLTPVVEGGTATPAEVGGQSLATLRAALLLVLGAVGIALSRSAHGPLPSAIRRTVIGLIYLAPLGLLSAIQNGQGARDLLSLASQAVGQPLVYALALVLFARVASSRGGTRALLKWWAFAVIAEGLLASYQLATGRAYDPLRGITRVQGTMGADFLGVFALLGIFASLALRRLARSPFERALAVAGTLSGIGTLVVSVSRGSLIGLFAALTFVSLRRDGHSKRFSLPIGAAVLVSAALYLAHGFWSTRLDSLRSGFDRPATWISGIRIALDHPFAGVGATHVASVVQSTPRYSFTPFGATSGNPHNAWLFVAAADGIPYLVVLLAVSISIIRAVVVPETFAGSRLLKAGMLGAGLVFVINNLFNHPEIMTFIMAGVALVSATSQQYARGENRLLLQVSAPITATARDQIEYLRGSHNEMG